jgi:single-stranded DNA-binding protein
MNREVHVRFCERVGLRCPARLTFVEGRLRTREYESKNGDGRRKRTEIVASPVQFLGAPPSEKAVASAVDEPSLPFRFRRAVLKNTKAARSAQYERLFELAVTIALDVAGIGGLEEIDEFGKVD